MVSPILYLSIIPMSFVSWVSSIIIPSASFTLKASLSHHSVHLCLVNTMAGFLMPFN